MSTLWRPEHLKEQAKLLRDRAQTAGDKNVKEVLLAAASEYEKKARMANRERFVS